MDYKTDYTIHKFAYLKLYIDPQFPKLKELYQEHILAHNSKIRLDTHPNSGFDLIVPKHTVCEKEKVTMVNFHIKTEMYTVSKQEDSKRPTAFFLMPRSSICKTPLILANHVGLIDSGYRGNIQGAFRCTENTYEIPDNMRLLQLCHPETIPIWVEIVDDLEDLSSTERGEGGFGSTGIFANLSKV